MLNITSDFCGLPVYSELTNNVYCGSLNDQSFFLGCPQGTDDDCSDAAEGEGWMFDIGNNVFLGEEC